jgi:NAD(P)-dependent dehydrogenase (short-subunit alcohol dehydrogenase family)
MPSDSPNEFVRAKLLELYGLEGKTAVVTGGGSGLGRRMGQVLAGVGAEVYFADLDEQGAEESAREASRIGVVQAEGLCLDVIDPVSVERAFTEVDRRSGKVDILVCSAGVSAARWIEEMELKDWNRVLNVNLTGTFLCCQAAARRMIKNHWGRIINIASIAALLAPRPERFNGGYNYSASKAGVIGLSKRLAVELAPYAVTVNCISPGIIKTPLTEKAVKEEETYRQIINSVPMSRLGSPEDLDGLVVYLASESSGFLTGQNIIIDGGYSVW